MLRLLCAKITRFMERAGEFLGRALHRVGKPEAALAWLEATWQNIVGDTLAAHTKPVRCVNTCLEITSDGKVWQGQLEDMKREFCFRVNQAWGGNLIQEIRFVPGASDSKRVPRAFDNDHTPFIRRRK